MGYVYFIQPCELIGCSRYKIGCSTTEDFKRLSAYRKGTRYICIIEVDKPLIVESILIRAFNEQFNLIAGKEYFEGNEAEMLKTFNQIVIDYILSNNVDNNIIDNKLDDKIDDKLDDKLDYKLDDKTITEDKSELQRIFPEYEQDVAFNGDQRLFKIVPANTQDDTLIVYYINSNGLLSNIPAYTNYGHWPYKKRLSKNITYDLMNINIFTRLINAKERINIDFNYKTKIQDLSPEQLFDYYKPLIDSRNTNTLTDDNSNDIIFKLLFQSDTLINGLIFGITNHLNMLTSIMILPEVFSNKLLQLNTSIKITDYIDLGDITEYNKWGVLRQPLEHNNTIWQSYINYYKNDKDIKYIGVFRNNTYTFNIKNIINIIDCMYIFNIVSISYKSNYIYYPYFVKVFPYIIDPSGLLNKYNQIIAFDLVNDKVPLSIIDIETKPIYITDYEKEIFNNSIHDIYTLIIQWLTIKYYYQQYSLQNDHNINYIMNLLDTIRGYDNLDNYQFSIKEQRFIFLNDIERWLYYCIRELNNSKLFKEEVSKAYICRQYNIYFENIEHTLKNIHYLRRISSKEFFQMLYDFIIKTNYNHDSIMYLINENKQLHIKLPDISTIQDYFTSNYKLNVVQY